MCTLYIICIICMCIIYIIYVDTHILLFPFLWGTLMNTATDSNVLQNKQLCKNQLAIWNL